MVMLNHTGEEVNAKIVYYGPGLSGKTTNLDTIHKKMPSQAKGKMVSMKTRTDRTLFFDFLPIEFGDVAGYPTRFLMYTVPGQVYYNATRKLVLGGVDAVVFVADSSRAKLQENLESLRNLEDNLNEHGLSLDNIPWVIQYNKRDMADAMPVGELEDRLNLLGVPAFEAVANKGVGVYETFEGIARLLYHDLRRRLESGEPVPRLGADTEAGAATLAPADVAREPEAEFDSAIDNALREVAPPADAEPARARAKTPVAQESDRVQAAGSQSRSQATAQPAASTRDLDAAADDKGMFESEGEGPMDDQVGRTLSFDDDDASQPDAEDAAPEFITDPMGSGGRAQREQKEAPRARPLEPRLPRSFDGPPEIDHVEAALDDDAGKVAPVPVQPAPSARPAPVAKARVAPKKEPARAAEAPASPPPAKPHQRPANEAAAPVAAKPKAAAPQDNAQERGEVLDVTVPVVITRAQVRKNVPIRLVLEIAVVDD